MASLWSHSCRKCRDHEPATLRPLPTVTPPLIHLYFILVVADLLAPIPQHPLAPYILMLYKVSLQPFP